MDPLRPLLRRALPERVYTRLGLVREAFGRARFRSYVAAHRYGDVSLPVHIEDAMGRSWYDHDWALPAEIALPAGSDVLVSLSDEGPYVPLAQGRQHLRQHSRIVALARAI